MTGCSDMNIPRKQISRLYNSLKVDFPSPFGFPAPFPPIKSHEV